MYNETFLALLCLHADKAKGLQINLSEALQGNIQRAFTLTLYCFLPLTHREDKCRNILCENVQMMLIPCIFHVPHSVSNPSVF